MAYRPFAALLVLTLVGCGGPTRTTGTSGLAAKDLAVLSIMQLPDEAQIKIQSIQFDEQGDQYAVGGSRDFYLTPGAHTVSFTFKAPAPPGAGGWFIPSGALTFPGPKGIPLGTVAAGKAYEFAPNIDSLQGFAEGGGFSLVREKPK